MTSKVPVAKHTTLTLMHYLFKDQPQPFFSLFSFVLFSFFSLFFLSFLSILDALLHYLVWDLLDEES